MSSLLQEIAPTSHGYGFWQANDKENACQLDNNWEPQTLRQIRECNALPILRTDMKKRHFTLEVKDTNTFNSNNGLISTHQLIQKWVEKNSSKLLKTGGGQSVIPIIASEKVLRHSFVCSQRITSKGKSGCAVKIKLMTIDNRGIKYFQWNSFDPETIRGGTSSPSGYNLEFYCFPDFYDEHPVKTHELFKVLSFDWKFGRGGQKYRFFYFTEIDGIKIPFLNCSNDLETVEVKSSKELSSKEEGNRIPFKLLEFFCKVQLSRVDKLIIGHWNELTEENGKQKINYDSVDVYNYNDIQSKLKTHRPFLLSGGVKDKQMMWKSFQNNNFNCILKHFHDNLKNLKDYNNALYIKIYRTKDILQDSAELL